MARQRDQRIDDAQAQIDEEAAQGERYEHYEGLIRGVVAEEMNKACHAWMCVDVRGLAYYCDKFGLDLFEWVQSKYEQFDETDSSFASGVRDVFFYRETYDYSAINDIINTLIDDFPKWTEFVLAEIKRIDNGDVSYE